MVELLAEVSDVVFFFVLRTASQTDDWTLSNTSPESGWHGPQRKDHDHDQTGTTPAVGSGQLRSLLEESKWNTNDAQGSGQSKLQLLHLDRNGAGGTPRVRPDADGGERTEGLGADGVRTRERP